MPASFRRGSASKLVQRNTNAKRSNWFRACVRNAYRRRHLEKLRGLRKCRRKSPRHLAFAVRRDRLSLAGTSCRYLESLQIRLRRCVGELLKGSLSMRIAQVAPLYEAVPRAFTAARSASCPGSPKSWLRSATMSPYSRAATPVPRQSSSRCGPARCGLTARCASRPRFTSRCWSRFIGVRASSISSISILDYFPFSLFQRQPTPFVTTLHGRLDLPELQPVFKTFATLPLVSISDSQRRPVPNANWVRTIHHRPMPENLLAPVPAEQNYLAFLGRISPEKRVDRAIAIAAHCGVPLKIAAKVDVAESRLFRGEHPSADRRQQRRVRRRDRRTRISRPS